MSFSCLVFFVSKLKVFLEEKKKSEKTESKKEKRKEKQKCNIITLRIHRRRISSF